MPRNERFSLPIPRILHDRSLRLFSVRIADLFRNYLYIEKPQGKPTLVPESDKRPAMNTAKNDFMEEYDNE